MKKPARTKRPSWSSLAPEDKLKLSDDHMKAANLLDQSSLSDKSGLAFHNRQLAALAAGEKFPKASIPFQVNAPGEAAVVPGAVVAAGQEGSLSL